MCKIAICDDEKAARDYINILVDIWTKARDIEAEIMLYTSAEDFLCDEKFYDIALLDIQMGEMNGLELAREIRKNNESVEIIFITGFFDYAAEGYDVAALNYLMKPVSEEKLLNILDKATEKLYKPESCLIIQISDSRLRIPFGKITYIEAFAHYVQINTSDGKVIETRQNISTLAEQLGKAFFRCHRSYIVSLKYTSQISKTDIILDSGKLIPLSRRLYKEANKAFINFHGVKKWD